MWRVLAIALAVGFASPARADEVPELVQRFLDRAREACVKIGGRPDEKPKITSLDLNGDGHADWIVHYQGHCRTPQPYCGTDNNCAIEIFSAGPTAACDSF